MEDIIGRLAAQEEACVLERFDADAAWRIGSTVRDAVVRLGGSALVDITVGDLCCFRCAAGTPTPHNQTWIPRKRNVVMEFCKSSLRVALEMKQNGKTLVSRGLDERSFALTGGGFPIHVKNVGVVGAVVCSGLTDVQDHQLIADAMAREAGVEISSIL